MYQNGVRRTTKVFLLFQMAKNGSDTSRFRHLCRFRFLVCGKAIKQSGTACRGQSFLTTATRAMSRIP